MKKYVSFLLIIICLVSCDVRRKDKIADGGAVAVPINVNDSTSVQIIDSVYNFGKATEGEKIIYNFRFKNSGTKPLVITNTRASCNSRQSCVS